MNCYIVEIHCGKSLNPNPLKLSTFVNFHFKFGFTGHSRNVFNFADLQGGKSKVKPKSIIPGRWRHRTTSMDSESNTLPNTTCLPSSQSHFSQVIKNWQPLVFGPLFACGPVPFSTLVQEGMSKTAYHREQSWPGVLHFKIFIIKGRTINAGFPCPVVLKGTIGRVKEEVHQQHWSCG